MTGKKGCTACGCIVAVFTVALAAAIVFILRTHVPSPLPAEQQKALVEELRMPAGTVLRDGVGIVILVDVSGSMIERVLDTNGEMNKKIEIAKRVTQKALEAIGAYAEKNPEKTIQVGVTRFGSHATEILAMGPPNLSQIPATIENLKTEGSTAIGEAMVVGKHQLNQAALKRQFMVVITDGVNTTGRAPQDVVKALKTLPEEQQSMVYVVAFDVAASVFNPLTQQGVPVTEARDAKGLQAALDYILYEKILVEKE